MKIKYENLKSGDIVFCGGNSLLAGIIRFVTAGSFRKKKDVATHCGVVVDLYGQKLIAEMMPEGLELNSLEDYNHGGKRFIVGVGRKYLTSSTENAMMKQVALDLRKGIEYDFSGVVGFILATPNLEEKFYCSEYVKRLYKKCGTKLSEASVDRVSPQDIFNGFKNGIEGELIKFSE